MKRTTLFVLALAILGAGCGKKDDGSSAEAGIKVAGDDLFPWPKGDLERAAELFGNTTVTASGLRWQTLTPGGGEDHPKPGDMVSAHYRGTLLDGTVFDESYKRGEPIRFPVGVGRVIKGWDEAIVDMRKGEKRRLIIPYWLAYGEAGRGPTIPPKGTLVFEVELVGWEAVGVR